MTKRDQLVFSDPQLTSHHVLSVHVLPASLTHGSTNYCKKYCYDTVGMVWQSSVHDLIGGEGGFI